MKKNKSATKGLYILGAGVLGLVLVITVLPAFLEDARIVYEQQNMAVIYALLSLGVAIVTFGILGDSEALVSSDNNAGLLYQVGGSFAGFLMFFYLLSSGLNPYEQVTIYLQDSSGVPLGEGVGSVKITIAGKVRQSATSTDGKFEFSSLSKSEERKLFIDPPSWIISSIQPRECKSDDATIRAGCELVYLTMERRQSCVSEMSALITDSHQTDATLFIVLDHLRSVLQGTWRTETILVKQSDAAETKDLAFIPFELRTRSSSPENVCSLINHIQNWFNRTNPSQKIQLRASCDTLKIFSANETVPEEYLSCS